MDSLDADWVPPYRHCTLFEMTAACGEIRSPVPVPEDGRGTRETTCV